jgi:hypothetical protein
MTLHQARSILTAAKPPEEFRQDFDPIDGSPTTTPDLTQKQREDLGRFNKQFKNEPQLHVTPTGRISRKPRGKR